MVNGVRLIEVEWMLRKFLSCNSLIIFLWSSDVSGCLTRFGKKNPCQDALPNRLNHAALRWKSYSTTALDKPKIPEEKWQKAL
jgi:hypothetical protein